MKIFLTRCEWQFKGWNTYAQGVRETPTGGSGWSRGTKPFLGTLGTPRVQGEPKFRDAVSYSDIAGTAAD